MLKKLVATKKKNHNNENFQRNSTLQTVYKTKRKIALYLIFQFYTNYTNYTNVWKLNMEATLKPKKPCQCFIERRNSHFIGLYYHCFNEWYGRRLFVHQNQFNYRRSIKIEKEISHGKDNIIHIRLTQLQRYNVSNIVPVVSRFRLNSVLIFDSEHLLLV